MLQRRWSPWGISRTSASGASLVAPTPLYAWSLLWHPDRPHPRLDALLRGFGRVGTANRRLDHDPSRDWLPGPDLA
ncbi:hypothetical protein [Embleya sp. MST-111070]|uniref:hypothetical protein n=1 Tax=Embleya sp. MST-111070 TaxID=3398231 RepID=UPI003F740E04